MYVSCERVFHAGLHALREKVSWYMRDVHFS